MSNMSNYIEKVKKYSKDNNLNELETLRYLYLNLGQRLSFDTNFLLGNSKAKRKIYDRSAMQSNLEEDFSKNIIICKSLSYIVEKILKSLDISSSVEIDYFDNRYCKHICNNVRLSDGRLFLIDLQDDLENIQSHSRTKSFGMQLDRKGENVISRFELEQIDKKLGYISKDNYYSDDYLYLIKQDMNMFDNFNEKVEFILENLEINENPNMQYPERFWHHQNLLGELFTFNELEKIRQINCYKDTEEGRKFINCISVANKNLADIYLFNPKDNMYKKISLDEFVKMQDNGLKCTDNVPGLKQFLRSKTKNEESDIMTRCSMQVIDENEK